MLQNGKSLSILKKAYEIGYAIFRMAPHITSPVLRERLERQALSLVDQAAAQDFAALALTSRSVEYLTRFGGDTGMVNLVNVETLVAQLNFLNSAIAESGNPATPKEVPLEGIFSKDERIPNPAIDANPATEENPANGNPAMEIPVHESGNERGNESGNSENVSGIIKSAIRQTAILDKIRQSGNCRLKEIQEILPECSERTIRYDLQSLLEQNLIERVGSGGPSVYYRARQGEGV